MSKQHHSGQCPSISKRNQNGAVLRPRAATGPSHPPPPTPNKMLNRYWFQTVRMVQKYSMLTEASRTVGCGTSCLTRALGFSWLGRMLPSTSQAFRIQAPVFLF